MAGAGHGIVVNKLDCYDKILRCEPDKSISVRAALLGGYAAGRSVVRNISRCDDVASAVECMRALGAEISFDGDTAYINGVGGAPRGGVTLDCGNSGTTAKLLLGLLAGNDGKYVLRGDSSLSGRPFGGVVSALKAMGADISGDRLPITVNGRALVGATCSASVTSAQEKSAVLLAGISAAGETAYIESGKTRDHTENLLKLAGADIDFSENRVTVRKSKLHEFDITVPTDLSAASYPVCLALGVKGGRCVIRNVGINDTRRDYLDILIKSGANVRVTRQGGEIEPIGEIRAAYTPDLMPLYSSEEQSARAIDEIPTLCALACFTGGKSVFRGVGKLRGKETDRVSVTCEILSMLGADIKAVGDDIIVNGGKPLRFNTVDSHGDHRMAMIAAVAGCAGAGCEILGAERVSVSYPRFFEEVIGV